MALAFFVVAGEQDRLRRCEAPDCRHAFVDLSRNRSRRYCDSRTCGNRLHVAAYRCAARKRRADGRWTRGGLTEPSAGDARGSAMAQSSSRSCSEAMSSRQPITARKIISGWPGKRVHNPRLLGRGGGVACVVSSISRR